MGNLSKRDVLRQKKSNTRDALAAAEEYCERHGFSMPLEYFLAIGNGKDPRPGADVFIDPDSLGGDITVADSTRAMAEAAKYIYVPASKIEVGGEVAIQIPTVKIDAGMIESLARKLVGDEPGEIDDGLGD